LEKKENKNFVMEKSID